MHKHNGGMVLDRNPRVRALQEMLFKDRMSELVEQEPQDQLEAYSERLLKQIHGDKVRHHYTCPKHGSYSIWIEPDANPEDYPHPCPVCEYEKEQENARRSEICVRMRRVADTVNSIFYECGVGKTELKTFEDFEPNTESQSMALDICKGFADSFCTRLFEKRAEGGMWISGPFGSGKTHLSTAILTVLQKRGVPGAIIKTADLVDALNSDPSKVLNRIGALSKVSCLVLDDFGATTLTDSEQKRIYQIVDARIQAHLPTIYTTNLSFEEFEKTFNGRLVSRIRCSTSDVPIVGPDHRNTRFPLSGLMG